jgi:hypothetical protein
VSEPAYGINNVLYTVWQGIMKINRIESAKADVALTTSDRSESNAVLLCGPLLVVCWGNRFIRVSKDVTNSRVYFTIFTAITLIIVIAKIEIVNP